MTAQSKDPGDAEKTGTPVRKKAAEAADAQREQVADAVDAAADAVTEGAKKSPRVVKEYAQGASRTMHKAADYTRKRSVEQMGGDVVRAASDDPLTAWLAVAAVAVGGGLLVAAMMRSTPSGSGQASYLSGTSSHLGPKTNEMLTRMRDAAISFAVAKAVEALDDRFPGFREHFDQPSGLASAPAAQS